MAFDRFARTKQIKARIATYADGALSICPIPGCGRLPQARTGKGLSLTHCKYHVDARSRFGSYWKRNIAAATLAPYKRAAKRFIKASAQDFWVVAALEALNGLLLGAGPVQRIGLVNDALKPQEKARAAVARLREADIAPEKLLIAYLSVAAAIEEDPIKPGWPPSEYHHVQAAKCVFRLRSGFHQVYGQGVAWHKYPRSSGRSLRHLGKMLEGCCEHVHHRYLAEVLRIKREGDCKPASLAASDSLLV